MITTKTNSKTYNGKNYDKEKTATKRNSHISKTRNSQRFNYGVFYQKGYPQKGYRLKVQRGNLSYQKGYRQADIVKTGINYNMSTKRVSTEKIATEKITTKNVSAKAYRLKRYRIKRYRQKRKKKDLTQVKSTLIYYLLLLSKTRCPKLHRVKPDQSSGRGCRAKQGGCRPAPKRVLLLQ